MPFLRRFAVLALGVLGPLVLIVLGFIAWVGTGTATGVAHVDGTVDNLGVNAPVQILRDARGIPHIRATTLHDAMFAEGYVTASDRLFQIDITRRFVLGRLSEMLGSVTADSDKTRRIVDVRGLAAQQYARLDASERANLDAFADGVNAAAKREPLPPEYRALIFGFDPWKPQDSLAVGFATVLDLADGWNDVLVRDYVTSHAGPHAVEAWYSLTDPAYDTPTVGGKPVAVAPLPAIAPPQPPAAVSWNGDAPRDTIGSNEFVAGAARTATGRALLANDPHLIRGMPGIWYLVDIDAPGLHVAGATLAGVPGVILGHNEHVAWGSTNGTVVGPRVYAERFSSENATDYRAGSTTVAATVRTETFHDRFAADRHETYATTRHGFVLEVKGVVRHAVQWDPIAAPQSPVTAFLGLDRAASIEGARAVLARYPGPTQNFVLADTSGRAGYALAGAIDAGPSWGLHVLDGTNLPATPLRFVDRARLPQIAASRDAVAVNSNNVPYGAAYPYRLSPAFSPPYRAAEITKHLKTLGRFDGEGFRAVQADTTSLAELEFARRCVAALRATHADRDADVRPAFDALSAFDGRFDSGSRGATAAQRVRVYAVRDLVAMHMDAAGANAYLRDGPAFVTLMRALRERPRGWFPNDDVDAFLTAEVRRAIHDYGGRDAIATPYGDAYSVVAQHPLAAFGFHLWDAARLPGAGGAYAPAVQGLVNGQSFRAVWDVGAWDAGGIDLPNGESGEPGSAHYRDLAARWQRHELTPLPFTRAAVDRAAVSTLVLKP